jgi:hypothetical protein
VIEQHRIGYSRENGFPQALFLLTAFAVSFILITFFGLTQIPAFSFYGKRKSLGKKKNPHASASMPRNAPPSCRIHAALDF